MDEIREMELPRHMYRIGIWGIVLISIWAVDQSSNAETAIKLVESSQLPTPGAAVAVSWSPDSRFLVAASDYGNTFSIWDQSGQRITQFRRMGGGPTLWGSIKFVHGSSQIVFPPPEDALSSTAFSVWDIKTGSIVAQVEGPQPGDDYSLNRAQYFAAIPDQSLLAVSTGANNKKTNFKTNLIVYDAKSWKPAFKIAIPQGISSLSAFAEGTQLAVGTLAGGVVNILDPRTGKVLRNLRAFEPSPLGVASISAVAGSADGQMVIVGLGQTLLTGGEKSEAWARTLSTAQILRVSDGARLWASSEPTAPIRATAWDPSSRFFVLADSKNTLFFIQSDGIVSSQKVPAGVLSLALAPDASRLAITTGHGVIVYKLK